MEVDTAPDGTETFVLTTGGGWVCVEVAAGHKNAERVISYFTEGSQQPTQIKTEVGKIVLIIWVDPAKHQLGIKSSEYKDLGTSIFHDGRKIEVPPTPGCQMLSGMVVDRPGDGEKVMAFIEDDGLPSRLETDEQIVMGILEDLETMAYIDAPTNKTMFYYQENSETRRLAFAFDRQFVNRVNAQFYRRTNRSLEEKRVQRFFELFSALQKEVPSISTSVRMVRDDDHRRTLVDVDGVGTRVLEIRDDDGWGFIHMDVPPFRGRESRAPLPEIATGLDPGINGVLPFLGLLNIDQTPGTQAILAGYLVSLFVPYIPRVALVVEGDHGSGKTTIHRNIKYTIDPVKHSENAYLQQLSSIGSESDLWLQAHKEYLVYMDNESKVKDEVSDSLCRLITGGVREKRQLYSDLDVVVTGGHRPLGLNTIESNLIRKNDLHSRVLTVRVPQLPPISRTGAGLKSEHEMETALKQVQPRCLQALLAAASHVQTVPERASQYVLERWRGAPPSAQNSRMLGWIAVCFAGIEHLYKIVGMDHEAALAAAQDYLQTMWEDHKVTEAESNPVVGIVLDWLRTKEWYMPVDLEPTDLYSEINTWLSEARRDRRFWAGAPQSLVRQLKQNSDYLAQRGYQVRTEQKYSALHRDKRRRVIIEKIPVPNAEASADVTLDSEGVVASPQREASTEITWKSVFGGDEDDR